MMSAAMNPLRESPFFISLMTSFSNPLVGILAGAAFTAVIQSSSAAVGILQALAVSGLIGFPSAVYVLFGSNIGTCITALLAAIGTNRAAKRTTVIHLAFNIIGTVVFTVLCLVLPITDLVGGFTPDDPSKQIANMHTIFNIVTTVLLLPFGTYLAKLAEKILPDVHREEKTSISILSEEFHHNGIMLGSMAVHTGLLQQEIRRMVSLAGANTHAAYRAVLDGSVSLEKVNETEETLDALNKELAQYISKILVHLLYQ
jgi:phosphate:Na+ symporter